jgi:hypothetical protein
LGYKPILDDGGEWWFKQSMKHLYLIFALILSSCGSPDKGVEINVKTDDGFVFQIGVKEGEWFMDEKGKYQCAVNLCTPADASAVTAIENHLGPRQVEQMKKYKNFSY